MNETLTQEKRLSQFLILSSVYGITFFFYLANFYSLAVSFSLPAIILTSLLLGPLYGFISLGFDAYLLQISGKWLGANVDLSSLRTAVAYSKAPTFILLGFWVIFLLLAPANAFIQNMSNGSAVALVFTSLAVKLWSFVLLFKYLKALQGFTVSKTLCALSLFYLLITVIYILMLFVCRYVYILL